jgi:hypothetical protein
MTADDVDLLILDAAAGKHAVSLARCGANVAIGRLDLDQTFASLAAFRDQIEKVLLGQAQRPKKAELARFGKELFDIVFTGDLLQLYAALPNGTLSVHILSNEPSVRAIPWEFLQDPAKPAGPQDRCIVRVLPTLGIVPPAPLPLKKTAKILFASADPILEPGVSWTDVQQTIERIYKAQLPERFVLKAVDGTSRAKLLRAVQEESFDIFHFFGHGEVKNGAGHLVLVDSTSGTADYLPADELAALLTGKRIRLAVLSACLTSAGEFDDDFGTVAGSLIKAGIPAVVANQMYIPNKSVAPFVAAMYRELLQSGDIDRAVNAGRVALLIELGGLLGSDAVVEWGVPTLYRLFGASRIFAP